MEDIEELPKSAPNRFRPNIRQVYTKSNKADLDKERNVFSFRLYEKVSTFNDGQLIQSQFVSFVHQHRTRRVIVAQVHFHFFTFSYFMVKLFQAASKHISLIEEIQRREREKQANILFYFFNFAGIDAIQKVLKFSSTKINVHKKIP